MTGRTTHSRPQATKRRRNTVSGGEAVLLSSTVAATGVDATPARMIQAKKIVEKIHVPHCRTRMFTSNLDDLRDRDPTADRTRLHSEATVPVIGNDRHQKNRSMSGIHTTGRALHSHSLLIAADLLLFTIFFGVLAWIGRVASGSPTLLDRQGEPKGLWIAVVAYLALMLWAMKDCPTCLIGWPK